MSDLSDPDFLRLFRSRLRAWRIVQKGLGAEYVLVTVIRPEKERQPCIRLNTRGRAQSAKTGKTVSDAVIPMHLGRVRGPAVNRRVNFPKGDAADPVAPIAA